MRLAPIIACLVAGSIAIAEEAWTPREKRILATLRLGAAGPPPPSPSNRVADDPAAAALGEALFFDRRLSGNGELSCASCHLPERYFTDGKVRSVGMQTTLRNAPTVVGSAWSSWFYWDGRRDSLWSQALIPFEALDEMGASRVAVLRVVGADPSYRERYTELFGRAPADVGGIEGHAGPFADKEGKQRWFKLPTPRREAINRSFADLGKAVAAYERTLLPLPSAFDRWVDRLLADGEAAARPLLSAEARLGAKLFIDAERTQCLQCHNGPMLTNGSFHNIGTGNFTGERLDFGRVFGMRAVMLDEFNCLGGYSDAGPDDCQELRFLNTSAHVPLDGAFKVPSLRNVPATAPYFHDGSLATLAEVVEHYRKPPPGAGERHELLPLELSDAEAAALVAFLEALATK